MSLFMPRLLSFFLLGLLLISLIIGVTYGDIGETPQEKKDLKRVQITRWQMCEGELR